MAEVPAEKGGIFKAVARNGPFKDQQSIYLARVSPSGKVTIAKDYCGIVDQKRKGRWDAVLRNPPIRNVLEHYWIGSFPTRKQAMEEIIGRTIKNYPGVRVAKSVHLAQTQIEAVIRAFEESGHSTHSSMAHTLPYITEYCERQRIPYRVSGFPGKGYFVEKLKSSDIDAMLFDEQSLITLEQRAHAAYCQDYVHDLEEAPIWDAVPTELQEKYLTQVTAPELP